MKCPVCKDVTLLMSEKKGIEIDYCPECRGIWLDRGELEKLLERHDNKYDHYDEKKNYHDEKTSKKRKKESFIGEIFEIFGE